ncbi:hypothetical protein TI39_contig354g00006 [Zymoseptoria brevis]|uniref:Uncharacterized protein n=1 Tax=Zymoseptoria brevis TaxID=1047168 RepID=A0A0F4GQT8_9PEZI|nr:hypothetical protein TI39_contig354g00006 [Zymoseptoria brevis]
MNEEFDQFDGGESPPRDEDEPKFSSKEERIIAAVTQMIHHEIPFRNLRDFWHKASKRLEENTRIDRVDLRMRILGKRLALKYDELCIRDERLPDAQQYINRIWRERRAAEAAQRLRDREQRAVAMEAAKKE